MNAAPPASRVALIACPAVELDVALHRTPERLTAALQQAISEGETDPSVEAVVLGYGLCSNAVLGLRAGRLPLVVPRVDDCVALVLGSNEAFLEQARLAAGTYYLSRGWIDSQCTVFDEHDAMVAKYGEARATRLTKLLLEHYTRLALVVTGRYDPAPYRAYAQARARQFELAYEEIAGTTALVDALVEGPWDERFLVVPPGGAIAFADFHPTCEAGEDRCARAGA